MAHIYSEEFLDTIAVLGFIIGIMNYDENLSQSDKDDMIQQFNSKAEELLEKLERDIEEQNDMLREILSILKENKQ